MRMPPGRVVLQLSPTPPVLVTCMGTARAQYDIDIVHVARWRMWSVQFMTVGSVGVHSMVAACRVHSACTRVGHETPLSLHAGMGMCSTCPSMHVAEGGRAGEGASEGEKGRRWLVVRQNFVDRAVLRGFPAVRKKGRNAPQGKHCALDVPGYDIPNKGERHDEERQENPKHPFHAPSAPSSHVRTSPRDPREPPGPPWS